MPQNNSVQNFQNTGMQVPPPFLVSHQNAPPPVPNPMQFSVPPPLHPGQPLLPPNFGSSSAPFHEPKTDVDDASVGKQCLDAWLRKRQRRNEDIEDTYTHPAQVSSSVSVLKSFKRNKE